MRFFVRTLRLAVRSLSRAPLRSGLTALGIVIGVGSVIAMLSIGNSARARIADALLRAQGNVVTVLAAAPLDESGAPDPDEGIRLSDYHAMRRDLRLASLITPLMRITDMVAKSDSASLRPELVGVDVSGVAILSRRLLRGTFFGHRDVTEARAVCVLSRNAAEKLFAAEDPVGRYVRLNDVPFLVIGVVTDQAAPDIGDSKIDPSPQILLPFTSMTQRLRARPGQIFVLLQARNLDVLVELKNEILALMEARRGSRKAEFKAHTVLDTVGAYTEQTQTMTRLLAAVGTISLLVGGVGIMNITLFSVVERTREIGIRLAIGMRPGDIRLLFLLEAILLALTGGVLGVLLGIASTWAVAYVNGWAMSVTLSSVVGALLCSVAVGTFFGFQPAQRASRLDPIDALRAD